MKTLLKHEMIEIYEDNNVVLYRYKGNELGPEKARRVIDLRLNAYPHPHPCIIDFSSIKKADINSLRVMSDEPALRFITASAVIVDSEVGKLFADIYYNMSKLDYPSSYFTNAKDAINWIEKISECKVSEPFRNLIEHQNSTIGE